MAIQNDTRELVKQLSQWNKDLRRLELEIIDLEAKLANKRGSCRTIENKIYDINRRIDSIRRN
jgi:CII-binding regulator of phage lambda lysogenization HflD